MTELNKSKNREKDNLARESIRLNMSPEEKELQRLKSRFCKEMNRKSQRQTDSADVAEIQKQNNRDSMMRSRQTERAKKTEMQKQNNRDSKTRKQDKVNSVQKSIKKAKKFLQMTQDTVVPQPPHSVYDLQTN